MLELGCGSGQAGIGAAARGAQVVLTDAVPLALQVARLNAWPVIANCRFELLRWGLDRLDEPPFPLIIGSDLVYDPGHFPELEHCARQHLQPGGRLLLSEPHRHTGDKFSSWIVQSGWSMQALTSICQTIVSPFGSLNAGYKSTVFGSIYITICMSWANSRCLWLETTCDWY